MADDVEGDLAGVDIDQMLIIDDAGNASPNRSGWQAFDAALGARLIPADVSASVAVMIDGQVVHQAAFGERIAGSGDPVEITDRFRIASISKTITAIVVMQLVEDGALTLDDPVGQRLVDHLGLVDYDPDVAYEFEVPGDLTPEELRRMDGDAVDEADDDGLIATADVW